MTFDHTSSIENETARTYHFEGMDVTADGVQMLQWNNADPDRHYLTLENSTRKLVTPGWKALTIESPAWE